jgi:hypothetical protein
MIKENNLNFKGIWAKYNNYEIIKSADEFYIRPVKKSGYTIYDVCDVNKELLVDFLLIGRETLNYTNNRDIECNLMSTESKYQEMVLEFVKKYGLLGDLTYSPLNTKLISAGEVYLQGYSEITKLSTNNYIKPFFVEDDNIKNIDFNNGLNENIIKYVYGNDNPALFMPNKIEDFNLVFSECYTEKIARILFYSKLLYKIFESTENSIIEENEDKKAIYQKYASEFTPNAISFSFDFSDNKVSMDWQFNSLKQAMEILLGLNEANDRKELKMCRHCGKPFIAKNIKAEYDSISCRNVANVYKNREKNK